MAPAYAVRCLAPADAAAAARAWNELSDGTLPGELVERIELLLGESGSSAFVAFVAEQDGEIRGIATARITPNPLSGDRGEIEALMIDERLPDAAGDALAGLAVEWLVEHGATSISHLRDPSAPAVFWERLGFRPDALRYTLAPPPADPGDRRLDGET